MERISSYLALSPDELFARARKADDLLLSCSLCPRTCGVNRKLGETGFCGIGGDAHVASWGPHFGEERPLVGRFGSGTIFFSGCNIGCIFCQNWTISHGREGSRLSDNQLAGVMLELQTMGCHNINLVTPTHQVPAILRALVRAVEPGLHLPLVYNCGGYESPATLGLLDGIVDIYMPDLKFMGNAQAELYAGAPDYPDVARAAVLEMHRQVGDLIIDNSGIARHGLLVRHLVMPDDIAGSSEAFSFIADELSPETYVNIMDQYHPCFRASEFPELNRRITAAEYRRAVQLAKHAGLKRIDGEVG
jgi:putative pyruvate formate lyase activating enzyme